MEKVETNQAILKQRIAQKQKELFTDELNNLFENRTSFDEYIGIQTVNDEIRLVIACLRQLNKK